MLLTHYIATSKMGIGHMVKQHIQHQCFETSDSKTR